MKLRMHKRGFAVTMAAMLLLLSTIPVSAVAEDVTVYVTVADENGALAIAREAVAVTDTDGDGVLTVADALSAAHEVFFDGGAAAGFACSMGEFGLKIDRLWGVENGGSYGYAVNHAGASNLGDPVKDGDTVAAYIYTDLTAWSDAYCYFDKDCAAVEAGESVTLTLSQNSYDENWSPVVVPVEGAVITLDGKKTDFVTGADGSVTVVFDKAGEVVVSAVSDSAVLVPPVCTVSVEGDSPVLLGFGIAAVVLIAAVGAYEILRKKNAK